MIFSNKKIKKRNLRGFSLAELIIALSVFSLIVASVAGFVVESLRYEQNRWKRVIATEQFKENVSAIEILRDKSWKTIVDLTGAGERSIQYLNNNYEIVPGRFFSNGVEYFFLVEYANRDSGGNIVEAPNGVQDFNTRKISLNAVWVDTFGVGNSYSTKYYINNWETLDLNDTLASDFNLGDTTDTTQITDTSNGEVKLKTVLYANWCNPIITLNEYDIPGNAQAKTIFATQGNAFLGTGGSADGISFTKLNIEGVNPPTLTVEGSFDGYLVNDIFVVGNRAYLSTTSDSKELVVLDITTSPYSELISVDLPGSRDAYSSYVVGNMAYVAQGRQVHTIQLVETQGASQIKDSLTIAGLFANVSEIMVRGSYLYASLNWDWYELVLVNVSNPSNISVTSQTSVNDQQTLDIYVSEDGNRTYFGTNSSSQREFFIIDTSVKSGARPIIASFDTTPMSIKGIAIIEADKRAILAGTGGTEYQVLNTDIETMPFLCGSMDVNTGINDIYPITDIGGNAFSYVVSGDQSSDFKIIRGGQGGGNGFGIGYPAEGTFISRVFDAGSTSTIFYALSWGELAEANADLKFQLRAGLNPDLSSQPWVGPDGTTATFFTSPLGEYLPTSFNGQRYIQYSALFNSFDTVSTYTLLDLNINFQR